MTELYQLGVLGAPTGDQVDLLQQILSQHIQKFGLRLGAEVTWDVAPRLLRPEQNRTSAAVFFCGPGAPLGNLEQLLQHGIPVLPVVSDIRRATAEVPELLRQFNYLEGGQDAPARIATSMLECCGLLPRQRRIFLSYRRDEARAAALQLFDAFAAKQFDVFLDTHGIKPAEDFQSVLWHRLCDSDVLVMLDTPTYFSSRWTSAEFGRALSKNISVLRVGWPDTTPSERTATASRAELLPDEVRGDTGLLADSAVERICLQLETVRSESQAVRSINLVSGLRSAVERIGGHIAGVGVRNGVYVQLPDRRDIVIYPAVGVPTSTTLHQAMDNSDGRPVAVVYDHVGLNPQWLSHLDWLGTHIRSARWIRACEAGWQLADWVET